MLIFVNFLRLLVNFTPSEIFQDFITGTLLSHAVPAARGRFLLPVCICLKRGRLGTRGVRRGMGEGLLFLPVIVPQPAAYVELSLALEDHGGSAKLLLLLLASSFRETFL